jgi:hypothetical protein
MRYIYIVSSLVIDKHGTPQAVNLGVHTSYSKARRHYDSVMADRFAKTDKHYRESGRHRVGQVIQIHKDTFPLIGETLRMEQWMVL